VQKKEQPRRSGVVQASVCIQQTTTPFRNLEQVRGWRCDVASRICSDVVVRVGAAAGTLGRGVALDVGVYTTNVRGVSIGLGGCHGPLLFPAVDLTQVVDAGVLLGRVTSLHE